MAIVRVPGSIELITGALEQLFQGHGVETTRDGEYLRFPAHPALWVNGELFREYEAAIQLDVRLGGFGPDRTLIESTGGMGQTQEAQIHNALATFADGTFHAILAAFFDHEPSDHASRHEWVIGGRKRTIDLGLITTAFGYPVGTDGQPDLAFFDHFKRHLEAQPLPPGTHWVRLYQMRFRGQDMCNEVLLDNDPWEAGMAGMAAFDWPVNDKPYDVRAFLVIRDPE
jgi:hypothetical protein